MIEKGIDYFFSFFSIHYEDNFTECLEQLLTNKTFLLLSISFVLFLFAVYIQKKLLSLCLLFVFICFILKVDIKKEAVNAKERIEKLADRVLK